MPASFKHWSNYNKMPQPWLKEQYHLLEDVRVNLTTPLTSEVEDDGGARPKTTSMAKQTSHTQKNTT